MLLGALLVLTGLTPPASPSRSPSVYGQVFLGAKSSIIRVVWTEGRSLSSTGFVVGAEGEVVFSAKQPPRGALLALLADGRSAPIELLGHDAAHRLAVGRLRVAEAERPAPLPVAAPARLAPETWVVVIRAREGATEPFAGVVESVPGSGPGTPRPTADGRGAARVAAPGDPGSPVLSTQGTLLAVVVEGGRRGCRAVSFEEVVPFLRGVVLGD